MEACDHGRVTKGLRFGSPWAGLEVTRDGWFVTAFWSHLCRVGCITPAVRDSMIVADGPPRPPVPVHVRLGRVAGAVRGDSGIVGADLQGFRLSFPPNYDGAPRQRGHVMRQGVRGQIHSPRPLGGWVQGEGVLVIRSATAGRTLACDLLAARGRGLAGVCLPDLSAASGHTGDRGGATLVPLPDRGRCTCLLAESPMEAGATAQTWPLPPLRLRPAGQPRPLPRVRHGRGEQPNPSSPCLTPWVPSAPRPGWWGRGGVGQGALDAS